MKASTAQPVPAFWVALAAFSTKKRSSRAGRGTCSKAIFVALATLSSLSGAACGGDAGTGDPPGPENLVLPTSPCSAMPLVDDFVRRDGHTLWVRSTPFRALGTNLYYLQQMYAYGEQGHNELASVATEALDHALCLGMSVVRTWGFNDSADTAAIRPSPGVFRETGLRGLDRAVAEAKIRGLRIVLTLTNNWEHYGGLPAYAQWAGKTEDAFFGDAEMMGYWKDYVSMLVNRVNAYTGIKYRDEPAILAWELGNEFRCKTCKGTNRVMDTVRALAQHVKLLDPNHLVSDGGEGFDDGPSLYKGLSNPYVVSGYDGGTSYSHTLEIEEIDLASYHFYPSTWGLKSKNDAAVWIDSHELLAKMAKKVPYLGEFGAARTPVATRDAQRAVLFESWLDRLFSHNTASIATHWQVIPASRKPISNDGYEVIYGEDPLTSVTLLRRANELR